MHQQGGLLPIWPLANDETFCMIGNHAIPVITDAYAKQILEEGKGRVSSIALLHNLLYKQEDFGWVNFKIYVKDLYEQVLQVNKREGVNVNFESQIPDLNIQLDTAIPFGLIFFPLTKSFTVK